MMRRGIVVLVATLASLVSSLATIEAPAGAQEASPSICSGGGLAGQMVNGVLTGQQTGTIFVPEGGQVRVAGSVTNTASGLFTGTVVWQLSPFTSGATERGTTTPVDVTWTNGGPARLVSVSMSHTIFGHRYQWSFSFSVSGGDQPHACRGSERLGDHEVDGRSADPVNTSTGNFWDTTIDLALPGVYGAEMKRTYNSLDGRGPTTGLQDPPRILGPGWTTTLDASLVRSTLGASYRGPDGRRLFIPVDGLDGWTEPPEIFATISAAGSGSEMRFAWGEVWSFGPDGSLTAMDNGAGQAVTITRAPGSIVVATTTGGAAGYEYELVDDRLASGAAGSDGLFDRLVGPDGRVVAYHYTAGRLQEASALHLPSEDAGGEVFSYTTTGQIERIETEVGGGKPPVPRVVNTYDAAGRVQTQVLAGGDTATFAYGELDVGAGTRTTVVTFVSGSSTELHRYIHDGQGRLISVVDPLDAQRSHTIERDRVATTTTPLGAHAENVYDTVGRLIAARHPDPSTPGATSSQDVYEYCSDGPSDGRVRRFTDAAGTVTEYAYGATGSPGYPCEPGAMLPSSVTTAVGTALAATAQIQSTAGLPTVVTDADGHATTLHWDTGRRQLLSMTVDGGPLTPGPQTTYYGYDEAARPVVERSPSGIETWFAYDGSGRLSRQVGPVQGPDRACDPVTCSFGTEPPPGPTVTYEYWADGSIKTRIDEADEHWAYERTYTGAGWYDIATEPDGDQVRQTYDPAGNLTSTTVGDPSEPGELATTTFAYGPLSRLTSRTSPEGVQRHFAYDQDGNLVKTIEGPDPNAADRTHTTTVDLRGRVIREQGPVGDTDLFGAQVRSDRTWVYDAADRVVETTDGTGPTRLRTWYRYDMAGRLQYSVVDRDGDGAPSNPQAGTADPDDLITEYRYTTAGRLAQKIEPPAGAASYHWLTGPQAAKRSTYYGYDAAGRLFLEIDPAGGWSVTAFDVDGRPARVARPGGAWIDLGYTPRGQVTSRTEPSPTGTGESTETWVYDERGAIKEHHASHQVGAPPAASTVYEYLADGHLESVTNPLGATIGEQAQVTFAYDSRGNLRSRTALANNTVSQPATFVPVVDRWEWNLDDQLTAEITPLGARTTQTYDTYGRPATSTEPSGRSQTTTWWNSGLPKTTMYGQPGELAHTTSEFWDDRGRPNNAWLDLSSVTTWGWSRTGELTASGQHRNGATTTLNHTWSLTGNRLSTTYPDGTKLLETPDALNRVLTQDLTAGGTTTRLASYTWNGNDHLTSETVGPSGSLGTRTWTWPANHASRPTAYTDTVNGTGSVDLVWRPDGRLATETRAGATTTYGYDQAGQLTSATGSPLGDETWTYSTTGAPLRHTLAGTVEQTSYDSDSKPIATTIGFVPILHAHDPDGRRTASQIPIGSPPLGTTITHDTRGHPTSITRASPTTSATTLRTYDATGTLVEASGSPDAPGALTWDRSGVLPRVALSGPSSSPTIVIHGPAGPVAQREPSGTLVPLRRDHDGSITTGTNDEYRPYGQRASGLPHPGAFGYRGELALDDLVHLRARDYDPNRQQFLTPDPLDGVPGTTTTNNPYHYANNDPLNQTDPTGLRPDDTNLLGIPLLAGGGSTASRQAWSGLSRAAAACRTHAATCVLVAGGVIVAIEPIGIIVDRVNDALDNDPTPAPTPHPRPPIPLPGPTPNPCSAPQTSPDGCDRAAWVIGESSRRTEAAAVAFGAQAWPGPPADATHYEACAANEAWLRGAIASAARIIDIGIDTSRQGSRSPYYELELRIVAETGYPVERRPWPASPSPYTPQDDGPCP